MAVHDVHDLRGPAVSAKRVQDHKSKWALGASYSSPQRPLRIKPCPRRWRERCHETRPALARVDPRFADIVPAVKPALLYPAVHDDDDVALADQLALEPDQACFYSFDRPTGPRAAEQLFDAAVTAAARVFENRQTEQLVSAEYEFLDRDGNTAVALSKPRRKRRTRQRQPPDLADVPYHNPGLSDDDDDDFELL